MYIVDLINKKRNNLKLSKEEIKYIIDRYCNDEIISGSYLQKKYNDYVSSLKSKGVI